MGMFFRKYQTTRWRSKRSEQRAVSAIGGRRQPNSGAINRFDLKADVKTPHFLVEDKTTDKASYALKVSVWRELSSQAWKNKRRPAMRLEFTGAAPLYIIDEASMMDFVEFLDNEKKTK